VGGADCITPDQAREPGTDTHHPKVIGLRRPLGLRCAGIIKVVRKRAGEPVLIVPVGTQPLVTLQPVPAAQRLGVDAGVPWLAGLPVAVIVASASGCHHRMVPSCHLWRIERALGRSRKGRIALPPATPGGWAGSRGFPPDMRTASADGLALDVLAHPLSRLTRSGKRQKMTVGPTSRPDRDGRATTTRTGILSQRRPLSR